MSSPANTSHVWNLAPVTLLRSAVREIPSMKYALGVGGVAAVVAIIMTGWKLPPQTAIAGTLLVFVAMVVLVIFSALSGTRQSALRPLALAMGWSFLILTIATATLFMSCAFLSWPKTLEELLQGKVTPPPPNQVVVRAESILKAIYARRYEEIYSQFSPTVRQAMTYAAFQAAARKQTAQLRPGPIHRALRGNPRPEGGFLFVPFDAEFDESSKWVEGVTFIRTDGGWDLYGIDMQPASWANATGTSKLLAETQPAAVITAYGTAAVDYWLPRQGWRASVRRVLQKRSERTCDVELMSGTALVAARNVLGGCSLAPGTAIDIVGKVTAVGTNTIDVDEVKYQLANL